MNTSKHALITVRLHHAAGIDANTRLLMRSGAALGQDRQCLSQVAFDTPVIDPLHMHFGRLFCPHKKFKQGIGRNS
jgi:hypothetical protein